MTYLETKGHMTYLETKKVPQPMQVEGNEQRADRKVSDGKGENQ